jgi:hypothetical protein
MNGWIQLTTARTNMTIWLQVHKIVAVAPPKDAIDGVCSLVYISDRDCWYVREKPEAIMSTITGGTIRRPAPEAPDDEQA